MDEEIDLRPYVSALLGKWTWIVGLTIVAALAGFLVSRLITPTYEATAIIAVTEARERVQLDPRFQDINEDNPLDAFPELAASDTMVESLMQQVPLEEVETASNMRAHLEARSGSDPSLLRFTATHASPATAARLANEWAALFVDYANDLFGDQGGEQLRIFQEQLIIAEEELTGAEEALIDFQGRSRLAIARNQLDALVEAQALSLGDLRSLDSLRQNVDGLTAQLAQEPAGTVTAADQLAALILQLKSFGLSNTRFNSSSEETGVISREEQLPIQLQLDLETALVDDNRQALINSLQDLSATLQNMSVQLQADLQALEPEILQLQQTVQALEVEQERLTRKRDVASETLTAIAYKVEEELITSQDTSSGVRLASTAAVPSNPSSPRTLLIVLVAAFLGFLASIFLILVSEWWRHGSDTSQPVADTTE